MAQSEGRTTLAKTLQYEKLIFCLEVFDFGIGGELLQMDILFIVRSWLVEDDETQMAIPIPGMQTTPWPYFMRFDK